MIETLLIANRGEIACRIIRTARRLGLRSIAVYSDADAGAQHVALADEAYHIGPAPARESYLCPEKLLAAAQASGAQAVHPGYGFLSENAGFAEACAAAGIVFVGPPPAAIRAMGSKSAAKEIMARAGVPLVPGYHESDQDPERLQREADAIGYPVLIKASAGGGGKGMRVVSSAADFPAALAAATREALAGFGDGTVLLEKYLIKPRHVEIQVFADSHGNLVHLFERDCSIQRRHQKVLEEAPAPGMTPELRARMGAAAVEAARAIGYVGAGTVEFLLAADGCFYFMEMNTRLQVEHPVTEMITGQDLVEWQLVVANGAPLPCSQAQIPLNGHAIEARIYAEDPARDFLPAIGRLTHLSTPTESAHVRIDTGVRSGDEVSIHYDPMIAKLIVWDHDRAGALRRLQRALAEFQVAGLATNLGFLRAVATHPAYLGADLDTGFIETHREVLLPAPVPISDRVLAVAALDLLLRRQQEVARVAGSAGDPWSPWHQASGWRLNSDNHHQMEFRDGEREITVVAHYRSQGFLLELPQGECAAQGVLLPDGRLQVVIAGVSLSARVVRQADDLTIFCDGASYRLRQHDPAKAAESEPDAGGRLTAPMPGKVIAILVEAGAVVKQGTPLIILEAMKMEHTITAPYAGQIKELHFGVGALVNDGAQLLTLERPEDSDAAA
ncbi:MAG: acetyl/propionyl/methylcrotonyl-CoA carboxylase subunit alpha [Trichloromonadaceae bacterium]